MGGFSIDEPRDLGAALEILGARDPAVRPFGGGTAIMLMIKSGLFRPDRLVSLRHLPAPFPGIALSADGAVIRIGATTTFSELEKSDLVGRHLPVVVRAMPALANVRVRNVATVGGNLAHGDPHLDLPPIWTALDGIVHIVGPDGTRTLPVEELFVDYYETALGDGELICELAVPVRPERSAVYTKVTTRAIHDWPALGIAVAGAFAGARVKDVRIVLSAAVNTPTRLRAAESVLEAGPIDDESLARAEDAACREAVIRADSRGSADYKRHLLRVYLRRTIETLLAKASAE